MRSEVTIDFAVTSGCGANLWFSEADLGVAGFKRSQAGTLPFVGKLLLRAFKVVLQSDGSGR